MPQKKTAKIRYNTLIFKYLNLPISKIYITFIENFKTYKYETFQYHAISFIGNNSALRINQHHFNIHSCRTIRKLLGLFCSAFVIVGFTTCCQYSRTQRRV